MKRLDLEPTAANILACMDKDIASRNADIKRFISLLDGIEPPFSICIDAPWGDGKTMFVKSVQMILEARNPNVGSDVGRNALSWAVDEGSMGTEVSGFLPVYFNAWMNDMLDNPLGSVIASMAADCEVDCDAPRSGMLQKAAAVVDSIGGLLGHGPNISAAVSEFGGNRLIDEYRNRRKLEEEISDFIDSVLAERAEKLVLCIDELDRCRPEYAIRLLGDIKNLFENERVIIVYSMDLMQLANALEGFYGSSFATRKYLERFYDKRFEMIPVREQNYFNETTVPQYSSGRFDAIVVELLQATSGTMRDMNRLKMTIRDAEKYAKRSRVGTDFGVALADAGLLPVFIFLEHEAPEVWRRVRMAQSLEKVYDFGAKSPAFVDFLDSAIRSAYPNIGEVDDDVRRKYVMDLCCLIFIDENSTDERRVKAYQDLGHLFWMAMDVDALRSFDFRRYKGNQ
ncbi:KAP family P-loop NTPase fold protein [Adlercreutzia mucosicola]|uniref:KAP family P-loop NTPase fold protein n=1 Tax=Adlercreutzia mucosicola TaxID=580026 RepID=UPI0004069522|nr:P-loop NTPase fold protein [Adlercreutzia mucosicola]MCR2034714.1 KAP family NTPase [Adlercreutzia mucosicola]